VLPIAPPTLGDRRISLTPVAGVELVERGQAGFGVLGPVDRPQRGHESSRWPRISRTVMTDNGNCYKSFDFRDAYRDLGLRHIRTKPYTPKTNGKAERFIQTALREWAYAQAYPTSDQRAAELPIWLHRYNWHRPHGSLKSKPPISRLALTGDNLLRLHS